MTCGDAVERDADGGWHHVDVERNTHPPAAFLDLIRQTLEPASRDELLARGAHDPRGRGEMMVPDSPDAEPIEPLPDRTTEQPRVVISADMGHIDSHVALHDRHNHLIEWEPKVEAWLENHVAWIRYLDRSVNDLAHVTADLVEQQAARLDRLWRTFIWAVALLGFGVVVLAITLMFK